MKPPVYALTTEQYWRWMWQGIGRLCLEAADELAEQGAQVVLVIPSENGETPDEWIGKVSLKELLDAWLEM